MNMRNLIPVMTLAAGLSLSPAAGAGVVPVLEPPWLEAPRLDGVWGDGEWRGGKAAVLSTEDCSRRPEVRLVETSAGLYVGILMKDGTPIHGRSPDGGTLHQEDVFEIFFELAGDDRRYAELQISRSGAAFHKSYVLRSAPEITNTGRFTPEFLERSLQETVAPVPRGVRWASGSSEGWWVAEVFLPRRLLGPVLRANFAVHDWDRSLGVAGRTGRFYYWSAIESGCPHISPSRFGRVILRS
jgi:hypothetical protein